MDATVLLVLAVGLALMIWPFVSLFKRNQIREDLLEGKDVVARWQLSLADLMAFEAADFQENFDGNLVQNRLRIRNPWAGESVEIVIGKRSWLIGDRLYRWGANSFGVPANVFMLDGDPGYIEIAALEPIGGPVPDWHLALLRLPVPVEARLAARAAATHFAAHVRPSSREYLCNEFPEYACNVGARQR